MKTEVFTWGYNILAGEEEELAETAQLGAAKGEKYPSLQCDGMYELGPEHEIIFAYICVLCFPKGITTHSASRLAVNISLF